MRAAAIVLVMIMVFVFENAAAEGDDSSAPDGLENLSEKIEKRPTIPELVLYAYEHNPSIQAARKGWRATVEQYRVATGYPDPQLIATYYPDPIETRFGPQDWNIILSQMIPFPGKLSKAGDVVETEARIARLHLDQTVRDITVGIIETDRKSVV